MRKRVGVVTVAATGAGIVAALMHSIPAMNPWMGGLVLLFVVAGIGAAVWGTGEGE